MLSSAVDFIRQTQSVPETAEQQLVGGKHQEQVHIRRSASDVRGVEATYTGGKWIAESEAEVQALIEERIATKRSVLGKKGITERDKPILIL